MADEERPLALPFIEPTDVRWTEADPGRSRNGGWLCSRCLTPIDDDHDVAIRAWPIDARYEYRYHPACLGFVSFGPEDDDDETDETDDETED